jgi:hypothetical protein
MLKEAVLIDDDELIRMGWRLQAEKSGILLHTFSSPIDFLQNGIDIEKSVAIYVDSNFGEGQMRGEVFVVQLHQAGYQNLYLATGYRQNHFSGLSFLKGIIGKESPWENDDS